MRKKIIIILGIMLLSMMMFGCSKSDDLKLPKNLELKDEYKKDISNMYPYNYKQMTLYLTNSYKNIETLTIEDLKEYGKLSKVLTENRNGENLTKTEKLLLNKAVAVQGDLMSYTLDGLKKEDKVKAKEDIKILLELYK